MGKYHNCLDFLTNEKMIIGMCDDMPASLIKNALVTQTLVEDEEEIESIKAKIKQNSIHELGSESFEDSQGLQKIPFISNANKNGDQPKQYEFMSYDGFTKYDKEKTFPSFENHNESSTSGNLRNGQDQQDLKHGLVISPAALTQDISVDVKGSNNKLSSVLEKIQPPLVYIPTTKQLIADRANAQDTISETGSFISSTSDGQTFEQPENLLSGQSSAQSTSTETILNTDDADMVCDSIKHLGGLDSYSIGENDSLLRLKEPDQFTCSSFDLEPDLHRTHTNDSFLRTFNDGSSLSSLSTYTDISVSAASVDDGEGTGHCIDTGDGFIEINLHSRNSYERTKTNSQDSGFEDKGAKPKKKGLSGFLSRSIFSRKGKEVPEPEKDTSDQQGWKLFGRVPPKQGSQKDPSLISSEYVNKHGSAPSGSQQSKGTKKDIEVMSTTALILENRPMNLPTKDPEEAERHRLEYEAMIEAAKKKEQKEIKQKKRQQQQQLKQEDMLLSLTKKWTNDILPEWDTMKCQKKTKELWWYGIPPKLRGRVWKLAIGNDLNLTNELYEICVSRAEDRIKLASSESYETFGTSETSSEPPSSKESSVELIKLDVSRTFPQLCIFQKGGPYHDLLHSLLGAYVCYRPDVGYVQGMSFIAAVLLLNMDVSDAFLSFANLLNRPCQVAFFRVDEEMMKSYFQTYENFFEENLPKLWKHFQKNKVTPDLYIIDWIFTLFSKSLPLDVACRVWDMFCRDGEEFLFRTALGILKKNENTLIELDFIHIVQFLTKLPEETNSDPLFKCIELIHMNIDKKNFTQVLAVNKDKRNQDIS